jgi:hypothetical protein
MLIDMCLIIRIKVKHSLIEGRHLHRLSISIRPHRLWKIFKMATGKDEFWKGVDLGKGGRGSQPLAPLSITIFVLFFHGEC